MNWDADARLRDNAQLRHTHGAAVIIIESQPICALDDGGKSLGSASPTPSIWSSWGAGCAALPAGTPVHFAPSLSAFLSGAIGTLQRPTTPGTRPLPHHWTVLPLLESRTDEAIDSRVTCPSRQVSEGNLKGKNHHLEFLLPHIQDGGRCDCRGSRRGPDPRGRGDRKANRRPLQCKFHFSLLSMDLAVEIILTHAPGVWRSWRGWCHEGH